MATGMTILTWFEGTWHQGNYPIIGASDHGAWLGSSVFDGARSFEGVAPDLDLHCARCVASAKVMGLNPPMTAGEITELAREGIAKFDADTALYIRPMMWAREGGASMVIANPDLLDIGTFLKPGHTPVVIAKRLRWVDTQTWQQAHEQALAAVAAWKQDWGSLDLDRYLAHYAQDFWAKGHNLARWSKRKAGVFSRKTYQKIRIADLNILRYPDDAGDGRDILVASFHQQFRSNNYDSDGRKQLFWVKQDGAWKVLFEGGG